METIKIENDIRVICVKAESFPDGIMDAFNKLNIIIKSPEKRNFYGLSRPEKGIITYWAAAQEIIPGESDNSGCEIKIIKKGAYIGKLIPKFMNSLPEIGITFQELIKRTDIDPDGYCVEWYINDKDVKCMVRLKNLHI